MVNQQDRDNKINNDTTKNPSDPRKNPRPGYDEKNPSKKDIQDHPEDQHTG